MRRSDIFRSRYKEIDLHCEADFEDRVQPAELFDTSARLGGNVKRLLQLAEPAQEALIAAIKGYCDRVDGVSYFDPGTKNYESALRKAYNTYGGNNRIRQLTDVYRASIVFNSPDPTAREQLKQKIFELLMDAGFELVSVRDSFETAPWSDGYRDINIRIKYRNGLIGEYGLIGELQINQCSIKNFTEFLGNKSYEIIENMWRGFWAGGTTKTIKEIVYGCLNKLTTHVYDQKVKEYETYITHEYTPSVALPDQDQTRRKIDLQKLDLQELDLHAPPMGLSSYTEVIDLHAPPMAQWRNAAILDDGMRTLHLLEAKANDEAHNMPAEVRDRVLMREQSQSPLPQDPAVQRQSVSAPSVSENSFSAPSFSGASWLQELADTGKTLAEQAEIAAAAAAAEEETERKQLEIGMRNAAAGRRTMDEPPPVVQQIAHGRRSGKNSGGCRLRQKRKITKKHRGGNKRRNTKRRQSKKSTMRR